METRPSEPDRQEAHAVDETRPGDDQVKGPVGSLAARKRAAVELISRHSGSLKQTARRYSLCAEDGEDAYQRGLEILLTKAPTDHPRELIRWTHTVIKHEALAIRGHRERLLGNPPAAGGEEEAMDWVALLPATGDGPDVRVERSERIARSREALQALKPAELRALTLLAEGYSYAEIGEISGFSATKVNRCIAEGRERFRKMLAHSEGGDRCEEIGPALSAFCDGEASTEEAAEIREHLRACASCRAAMRAYRAAPGAAAALVPVLPLSRSLLERAHDAFSGFTSRLSGGGAADSTVAQVATAGGTKGAGMAGLAKLLAVCAGTAGGATACVVSGVAPAPIDLTPSQVKSPTIERSSQLLDESTSGQGLAPNPAPESPPPPEKPKTVKEQAPEEVAAAPVEAGGVEQAESLPQPSPPPEPPPQPVNEAPSTSSQSAAGEFGP